MNLVKLCKSLVSSSPPTDLTTPLHDSGRNYVIPFFLMTVHEVIFR